MRLKVFNPTVKIFNVFADDDHVHAFSLVAGWDTGKFARWAHVGVRLKELAQRDVGALLTESNGGLEWALQCNAGAVNAVARCLWDAGLVTLQEDGCARLCLLPIEGHASARRCRIKDALCGEGDLGANAVARDQGDRVASNVAHHLRIAGSALSAWGRYWQTNVATELESRAAYCSRE